MDIIRGVTQFWFMQRCLTVGALVLFATWGLTPAKGQEPAKGKDSPAKTEAGANEAPASAEKPADAHATKADESKGHEAAHGGHHDESDLGHQNATTKIEDPSEWKSDLALWTLITFLGLLLVLSKFAWGPVMAGLEKRERAIAANIEEAKRSADKAAAQLRQYEARLAAAADEAREIVGQARKDADTARERIMAEAQTAAQRERQRAIEDINMAKKAALQEMTEKSVDLAVLIAGQLVQKQLNREDQAKLIRETLDKFPSQN